MQLEKIVTMSPEQLRGLLSTTNESRTINCRINEPIISQTVRIVNGAELMSVVVARVVTISDDRGFFFPDPRGIKIDEGFIFCGRLYHDCSCSFNGNVKAGEVFKKPGSRCSSYIEEGTRDKPYCVLLKG